MTKFLKSIFIIVCAFFAINIVDDNLNNSADLIIQSKAQNIIFNNTQKQYAVVQNNNTKISNPNNKQDFGFGIINVDFLNNSINKFYLKNSLNNYLACNFSKNLEQEINIRAP